MPHHTDLTQGEGHEDADDVQLNEGCHFGLERHHEQDRHSRQEDDAVGERETVAAGV
ncbi:Uncharacterised protein [Mycobacteroides abscessus subsp. abscessus]|nr:Uncharacterised protein [Mycobacteroides abscessus subsp. abscessus]